MAENKLTDKHLRTIRPLSDSERTLGDGGGLWIRVLAASKGGAVNFYYRFELAGKERRYNCGTFPETSLQQARQRRNAARQLVEQGIDPVLDERAKHQARAAALAATTSAPTVSELFADWDEIYLVANRKDKGEDVRSSMVKHVLPHIGSLKGADIRVRHVVAVLDRVVKKGKRRTANKLLSHIRQMYRHAIGRGLVEHDPTLSLTKKHVGGKEMPKTRNLSSSELSELARRLPPSDLGERFKAAIWFLLATGARPGELTTACKSEIECGCSWRIPPNKAKNGHEHVIHLSAFAKRQLSVMVRGHDSAYLLPGRVPGQPMDDKSLSKAVRDRIRAAPLKRRTPHVGSLVLSGGAWTPHDLRRTFASRMGDLGVAPHIIERCLNHVPEGIEPVYQRQEYLKERKVALERMGKWLSKITSSAAERRAAGRRAHPRLSPDHSHTIGT